MKDIDVWSMLCYCHVIDKIDMLIYINIINKISFEIFPFNNDIFTR